jgi:uncharacterized protein YegP (UPF0339 family)
MKIFTLKKSKDKQFFFILKGMNGQILTTSETYTRRENAIKGIRRVLNAVGLTSHSKATEKGLFSNYVNDETK